MNDRDDLGARIDRAISELPRIDGRDPEVPPALLGLPDAPHRRGAGATLAMLALLLLMYAAKRGLEPKPRSAYATPTPVSAPECSNAPAPCPSAR